MGPKPLERQILSVDEDGSLRFIYNDNLKSLISKGECTIQRASHVEPVGDKWYVDLTPIGGPRMEKLFDLREDALREEVKWLEENWL
jgi:hypothetical protein